MTGLPFHFSSGPLTLVRTRTSYSTFVLRPNSNSLCRVNFDQRLGQEIHEVEIDADEVPGTATEMTTVDRMIIHPFPSFHVLRIVTTAHLFDWLPHTSRSRSYEPSQSRRYEQDLATWRNTRNEEAAPLARRVPLPACRSPTEVFSSIWTVHHPKKNKISFAEWFNPSILQDNNTKQNHLHSTSNFANHMDKSFHLRPAALLQNPEAAVPFLPIHHLEETENIVLIIFPFQNSFDLGKVDLRKVAQKLIVHVNQMQVFQHGLAQIGLTKLNNKKMDNAVSPPKELKETDTQSFFVSFLLKNVLVTICSTQTSTCLGWTTPFVSTAIVSKLPTRWSTFGFKNHIAGFIVIN